MKTMMKISNLMTRVALTLLVMMLTATTAWADDSGECGEGVTYYYNASTHTLTISGSGAMQNYDDTSPWYSYCADIRCSPADFIARGGRIPAPLHALKN